MDYSNKKNPRIGLVLGSGGARGLAHIGVIEGLEAHGYSIDRIAGCSIGALVGAVYASGNLPAFKNWMLELDFWDVFRLMDFTFNTTGFIKGEKVFDEIGDFLSENIESLPIPFCAVATDLHKKKDIVFTKGNLFDAVRSSIAIPTVLLPREIGDNKYIDGGIVNPLPVNLIDRQSVDMVVAVNLNSKKPYQVSKVKQSKSRIQNNGDKKRKNLVQLKQKIADWLTANEKKSREMGFFDLLNNSFDLTQDSLTAFIIEKYQPDILVEISRDACGTMEFYKAEEMINAGRQALDVALGNL